MTPEIDSDAVKAIADSYGLDAEKLDKTLRHLVDSKAGGYEVAERQAVGPGEKELKILLRKMKKHACALRKTLDEVPVMTGFHAELFYKYKHLYMLKNELDDLVSAIDTIKPKSKRGKTLAAHKRDMFITHMAMFWWRQTGKGPTYTTDPFNSERTGDFLDFLTAVARLLGIDTAPLPERFLVLKRNDPIYKELN